MNEALENPQIIVIGSANMDLVVTAPAIPFPGQTLLGNSFQTLPGGKGANQALAAARLTTGVAFVGRVGDDEFGRRLSASLESAGVNCQSLSAVPGVSTGIATITVARSGENAICVVAGANGRLAPADIEACEPLIAHATVCVFQLEIPMETVLRGLDLARRHGVETILDPAPAPQHPPERLLGVDILSPNQSEAAALLGWSATDEGPEGVARALQRRGARAVVLKLGSAGAFVADGDVQEHVPTRTVNVIDTTAAGDAFTAALAVARAAGKSLLEATRFANAAGSLACTRFGAQPSMPTRAEVEKFLRA